MDGQSGGNVFSNSLYDLGQYLLNNPQALNPMSGTSQPAGAPSSQNLSLASGSNQPTKIVTQWHYASAPNSTDASAPSQSPQTIQTSPANTAPTTPPPVSSSPANQPPAGPAPSVPVQTYPVPQGSQGVPVGPPGPQGQPATSGSTGGTNPVAAATKTAQAGGTYTGPGSGYPTANAISGAGSAIAQGLANAGQTIGNVKTMPAIIQGGQIPSINQVVPQLIGRSYV